MVKAPGSGRSCLTLLAGPILFFLAGLAGCSSGSDADEDGSAAEGGPTNDSTDASATDAAPMSEEPRDAAAGDLPSVVDAGADSLPAPISDAAGDTAGPIDAEAPVPNVWPRDYPGVTAKLVSGDLGVWDFLLASDLSSVVSTTSTYVSYDTCPYVFMDMFVRSPAGFVHQRLTTRGAFYSAQFTRGSNHLAFVERGNYCADSQRLITFNSDGTNRQSYGTNSGGHWQRILNLAGDTLLTVEWRYPNSIQEHDGYFARLMGQNLRPTKFAETQPELSPDGKAAVWRMGGAPHISAINQKDPTRLTSDTYPFLFRQLWSPDGQWYAFVRAWPVMSDKADVGLVRADGTGLRILASNVKTWDGLNFSPDSTHFTWRHLDDAGTAHFNIIELATGNVVPVTGLPGDLNEKWPKVNQYFTPTGRRLYVAVEKTAFWAERTDGVAKPIAAAGIMSPDDAYVVEWNYEISRLSVAPTTSENGRVTIGDCFTFLPLFAPHATKPRLAFCANETREGASSIVLIDGDGQNRVELPGRTPAVSDFGLRETRERSRVRLGPTWVNNSLLYATNLRNVGLPYKVFDIVAASLDGRTVGILAKDVVNFDWSPAKPTELFFVQYTNDRTMRLWHVPIP